MAKLYYVVNDVVNVIINPVYIFGVVCYVKYREFSSDFVVNVTQNVIKLDRNGLY